MKFEYTGRVQRIIFDYRTVYFRERIRNAHYLHTAHWYIYISTRYYLLYWRAYIFNIFYQSFLTIKNHNIHVLLVSSSLWYTVCVMIRCCLMAQHRSHISYFTHVQCSSVQFVVKTFHSGRHKYHRIQTDRQLHVACGAH